MQQKLKHREQRIAFEELVDGGEVRFVGEIDSADAATRKLVSKLAAKYRSLTFCYEAGPTGYGLYRLIRSLGHECVVAAPSLIPKKPGVRVKTNRRDAVQLAKLSRAEIRSPEGQNEEIPIGGCGRRRCVGISNGTLRAQARHTRVSYRHALSGSHERDGENL
jgi:transposase